MSYLDDLEKLCELKNKKLLTEAEFEIQKAHLLKQGRVSSVGTPNHVATGSKSKTTYILLGFFLGFWGVHNFYAGRIGCAIPQLILWILGVCTVFFGIGIVILLAVQIWVLVDICAIRKDGTGKAFI